VPKITKGGGLSCTMAGARWLIDTSAGSGYIYVSILYPFATIDKKAAVSVNWPAKRPVIK